MERETAGVGQVGRRGTNPWLAWVLAGSLAFIPTLVSAQTSGAAFLKTDPSPQSFAMGNSNVVTSLGAQANGANPANLGSMSRRFEVFSSYASMLGGVQYGHLAAAMALPSSFIVDSLGFSVTRVQSGSVDGADNTGNATGGSFGTGNLAVGLSGSGRIGSSLRLGLTGKAIQENIAGYNSNTALAGDVGLTYAPHLSRFNGLSIGLSVNNMGQGVKFINQTDALPTSANLGAAIPLGPAMGVVTVNRMIHEQTTHVGVGMEYGMGPIDFRGGFLAQGGGAANLAAQDQTGASRIMNGLSGGMGIKMGNSARLDYAVSEGATDYGTTQRVALMLQFGDKSGFNTVSKASRRNTRSVNEGQWQQSNEDSIDWHMIQLGK